MATQRGGGIRIGLPQSVLFFAETLRAQEQLSQGPSSAESKCYKHAAALDEAKSEPQLLVPT